MKGFRAAQFAYDNMMPPEEEHGDFTECVSCDCEFEFDAAEYTDADEDGVYVDPPKQCPECASNSKAGA